ncbi:hypothetical protein CY35_07G057400 [Sphagnum magellanicum]|uniref:Uncharacterized protein n=1 Tax=Sphagnum magellanicum TaxID=128215 RepID=A0ACB8HL03_9BRYO|nr:hypothetical protein CY35_07G057400 [Sphagnum magellanicum]
MAQGHLSNCCTSSSCFERSCFLQSIRGSSNPRENGRSNFTLKLHIYPSIICRQFVVVRASLPPHHHHPSSSSLTSAATSSSSSNKTLQCPPPHGLLLRYTSLSRRTGGFVPCNAARSSALSESEEMMPTTSRRVTDNRLPQLVDVVPPVVEFKLSDFELCSHVSVGLAGRGDEVVYEGVVRNPESPLRGMRVVLRQLTGPRAQRWGHRALQVIARLVRREDLYHSYATRVHGYILPSGTASDESNTLTLVHGYYGSYSLHQWLLCHDWLPNLEARLALDEEAARRVGDDRTGGPEVSRQLRLLRVIMRDLLIGLNYVHSRGLAHTELRLQNVHISAADRHVKVGILGNAADFPGNDFGKTMVFASSDSKSAITRRLMIAFDIRCVGYMMAKMVLRELMDPAIFSLVKNFLTQGHDPAGLREFFSSLVKSASGNTGVQILDRDGGAGWNLLACMLTNKSAERISCTDALRHPFLCGPKWRVESSLEMTRWSLGSFAVRIVEDFMYGTDQRNRLSQLIDLLERVNPNSSYKEWMKLLPGRWRLLYHTGKPCSASRQPDPRLPAFS